MKILIIDDELTKIRSIVSAINEVRSDLEITTCITADDARKKMRNTKYDLVILDLALPNLMTSHPDMQTGINLLTQIIDDDILVEPNKLFCLTGLDNIPEECEELILDKLVILHKFAHNEEKWKESLKNELKRQLRPKTIEEEKLYKTDVLLITALKTPELSEILKLSFSWEQPELCGESIYVYKGVIPCRGTISSKSIVATSLPKMGPVCSATFTSMLISKLRPKYVVMTGISAGLRKQTNLGDVILAATSWGWEYGKWSKSGRGEKSFELDAHHLNIDNSLVSKAEIIFNPEVLSSMYNKYPFHNKPDSIPTLIIGSMACGSSVIAESSLVNDINKQSRSMVGLDMESYGVYYACSVSDVPRPNYFCLKGVCDFADDNKGDTYQDFAAYMSAKVFMEFIYNID